MGGELQQAVEPDELRRHHHAEQPHQGQPHAVRLDQATAGTLPDVSWLVPQPADSEHPPALISSGQEHTTRIINAVMKSSDWNSAAIFMAWDDWGGCYDDIVPPTVDGRATASGFPALSSARTPNDFMGGARLDPATDGRPDSRPDVRENLAYSLTQDFNFDQAPRSPLILNPCPATTLVPANPGCTNSVPLHFKSWGDS